MAVSIGALKHELTGYMYKKISNLPKMGQLSSVRYLFYGGNLTNKLASADVNDRYQLAKEELTASKLTVAQYAITYNDLNILQLTMKDFTSDQKYSVLAQQINYELSGSKKVGSTLEYTVDILCAPSLFPCVDRDNVEEVAQFLLNGIKQSQRLQLVEKNHVLTRLINAASLSVIQVLLHGMSYDGIIEMLQIKNRNQETILETILFEANFELLELLRSELTQSSWFQMLIRNFNHKTPVQLAMESNSAQELLRYMLRGLTSDEVVEALRPVNENQRAHSLALEKYLMLMMELTTKEGRAKLLTMQGRSGDTPLHLVAIAEWVDLLNSLLDDLTKSEIFQILNVSNQEGCTVLHIALSTWRLRSIKSTLCIFRRLYSEDQLRLIRRQWKGQMLVHVVAERNATEIFDNLLLGMSDDAQLHLLGLQNGDGMTVLHCAVRQADNSLALVKSILEKTGNQKHRFLSLQCNSKMTPIHYAMYNSDIAIFLLQDLEENQLYDVVSVPDQQGDTILHKLSTYCELFRAIFSKLSLKKPKSTSTLQKFLRFNHFARHRKQFYWIYRSRWQRHI